MGNPLGEEQLASQEGICPKELFSQLYEQNFLIFLHSRENSDEETKWILQITEYNSDINELACD